MNQTQESALIDWTAAPKGKSFTTTKRLTREELLTKINYPIYKKRQEKLEPLGTDIGRRALEIFHTQKRALGNGNRLRMATNVSSKQRASSMALTNNNGKNSASVLAAAGNTSALGDHPHVPLVDLPNLSPGQLDEELTAYLESIAVNGDADFALAAGNYLGSAVILQLKGRHTDALDYYSKCVAVDPMLTECYLYRAQCFTRLEQPLEALEEYKKYLQMEPATKALLADSGKCALDADKLDEAEQLFLACLSIGSPSTLTADAANRPTTSTAAAGAASVAALLLRNRQQQIAHDEAAAQDESASKQRQEWNIADDIPIAAEDQTHDSYSFYNLGEVEERRGNAERATLYYGKVHPSFATPYFEQGRQEFAKEDYPMALRLFEAVAKVLPDEVSVHLWLADTYTALGINEFSLCVLTCLTKAIALPEKASTVPPALAEEMASADPDSRHLEPTLLRRGMLNVDILGDLDSALTDFSMCLAYNGRNADALLARARTLLLRNAVGDEELAVADYELVVTLPSVPQSERAHPYEILGLYYEKKKRFVEAGRLLALAVCAGAQPPLRSAYRCITHSVASAAPSITGNGEELHHRSYDARGWIPKPDATEEKSKKGASSGAAGQEVSRSAAVLPLSYSLVDSYYQELRSREPTVHRSDECSAIEKWQPVRIAIDKRREEAEAAKSNKKKKR